MEYFREKQRPFILIMRGFRIKLAIIRYFASKKKRLRKNKRNWIPQTEILNKCIKIFQNFLINPFEF